VIGKNITRFHCLYWPAMLMSAGLELPKQVFAHGFMLDRGERMSKTRGNTRDAGAMSDLFGVDGVRYLVLREVPFDRDGDVTFDGMVRRYNADLANDLGNLVNRTVSMSARYVDGALRAPANPVEADRELQHAAERAIASYHAAVTRLHFDEALAAVIELTRAANGYVESQAPWSLNKSGQAERLGEVLATIAETCRLLAHLAAPFMPASSQAMLEQLGMPPPYDARGVGGPGLGTLLAWGGGPSEWRTGQPVPIFPRVEVSQEAAP
jgi:methionyl-tRNA synthetase